MTIEDVGQARTTAAIEGVAFDNQDDWCEACSAYHVAATHAEDVPVECGNVAIQGFSFVAECNRPPHEDRPHRDVNGTSWN